MFKASLGTTVNVTTIVMVGLFVISGIVLIGLFIVGLFEEPFDRKSIMMPIVALALLDFYIGRLPIELLDTRFLNEGVKIIKRNNVELIKKELILEVKPIDYKDLRFSVRTFGIGGVFGFSGSFTNKSLVT